MNSIQLQQIKDFSIPFYSYTDQFHGIEHVLLTVKYALRLANAYPHANLEVLEAACYLHDIGRSKTDEGHAHESANLAKPFLKTLDLPPEEKENILQAVDLHSPDDVHKATTIEAKLLYDADKIQLISIYGFLRMAFFMFEEKHMTLSEAIEFRWQRSQKIWKTIQTEEAKKILGPEIEKTKLLVEDFKKGLNGDL